MRSIITPVVALLWIALPAVPAWAQIPWNNDLQAAHAQAKQEGKRLLMHFYTDNCVYCDRLEAGAFQSPALAAAIEKHFVPVKIHAAMNPKIAKTFRVTRFPTDVIVTTDGTVLSHGVSPQDPNRFINLLAQHAPSTPSQTAFAQAPASPPEPAVGAPQQAAASPAMEQTGPNAVVSMPAAAQPKANPYSPSAVAETQREQAADAPGFGLPTDIGGPPANVAAYRPQRNPLSPETAGPATATLPPPGGYALPADDASSADSRVPTQMAGRAPAMSDQVTIAADLEAELTTQMASTTEESAGESSTDDDAEAAAPPVALQGFCPVALVENEEWTAGDPAYGAIHLGQLYLFTSQASMEKFRANPDPYTPVMNGNDVVLFFDEHRVVEGRRDWGLWDPEFNRIFLFASEETMNHFYAHHQNYVRSAITVTRQAAAEANRQRR